MVQISAWKRIAILGVILLGLLYAMPNLFYQRVETHNDAVVAAERAGFESPEQAAARAQWPGWLPSSLVALGLDLRGGAHLLGEVNTAEVYASRMTALWPELRDDLAQSRDVIGPVRRVKGPADQLLVEIGNPDQMARAVEIARKLAAPVASLTGAGGSTLDITARGNTLIVQLSAAEKAATDDRTIQQSLEIVRRRVDEVGTREPTIQRQGKDRILIQVPGIGSAEELKALIGTTAKLTFNPVIGRGSDPDAAPGLGNIIVPSLDEPGVYYTLAEAPVVTGEDLTDARPGFDQNGAPSVDFRFGPQGARRFGAYTSANVGQPFAIVLDNQVISAPVIRQAITTGSGQISGAMDVTESNQLAVLLRAGALPAEMTFLEERTIGPELGQDSIDAGRKSAMIATVLVVGYMIASYGLFGVFASVAVITNVILILSVMGAIGATLTLPGIAGIVLTVGTAVDANVIIYERIREELRSGKSVVKSINDGFGEAMSAIIDANLTTFIAALVMFFLGSGPVKGFAVTLTIGLVTSVFTAIYFTRLMIVIWLEWRKPKTLVL
ncbi:protein translocase subunit SecD [Paracoccus alkenifer]|uniref:Protein translocase subunit SecD n=1 Tax=Paracoccus alkenifer TaxID=65735 RepID=A0A1H6JT81_9RHOB|nr:protein translocase subunit SecD [Paracoccus alkenifer]SEH63135.1 preprotein translocase subunit SecD [Paracoccus alkenifer]